jgi:hypothetical protein
MHEPLENLYFNWLCSKVMHVENSSPTLTYWNLLRVLHNTEFVWLVVGDDNRAEDGLELRRQFLIYADIPDQPEWRALPCSLFEMLIAFASRAEFQTEDPVRDWFWEFIDNLGLAAYNDASQFSQDEIGEILYQLVWRTYDYSGRGGLFPLDDPPQDQTKTEIWYQFCEYLVDQHRLL